MTTEPGRKNRAEAILDKLTERRSDLRGQARQIRCRGVDRRLPSLSHEGFVGAGALQGLNVARTVTSHSQRGALTRKGAIRRVVVDSVQVAHHAAVACMSDDHRGSADPFDRHGRRQQLQLNFGVGGRVRTRTARDVWSGQ